METLGQFLDDVCSRDPSAEAIAYAPAECVVARMTWGELHAASRVAAKRLNTLGVEKNTRVGLLCPNRIDWLPLAFGVLRLGAVLVPFSTLWKKDELAYGLRHANVRLLLTVRRFLKHDYVAALKEVVPELDAARTELFSEALPDLRRVICIEDGETNLDSFSDVAPTGSDDWLDSAETSVRASDVATIFFTSGTTAQAKAVVHSHGALVTSGRRLAPCFGITAEDAWWGHMPLFWSGGFVLGALASMAGGARLVLQETVSADSATRLLAAERCTLMAGWHQAGPLLEHSGFSRDEIHLRKGTYHQLAPQLLGPDNCAIGVYGMSETATCVTAARWDDPEPIRAGTFGRPLAGSQVRIVDPETGQPRAVGEIGEIQVKGPTLMEGYLKVPPRETFDAEGFFRTGDLGYLDAGGYLHFANRVKDVIKTAGVNVAAAEVEEALVGHPSVKSAHVVGIPHPVRGENIAAFVVLSESGSADAANLRDFCRLKLASYKVPREIFMLADADVPRTGTGKIEKAALRRMAIELAGESVE